MDYKKAGVDIGSRIQICRTDERTRKENHERERYLVD